MTSVAEETTPGFRDGDRHGAIDRICAGLESILLGQAAAEMLDAGAIPPAAALAVLPCWTWVLPGTCVGRKGKTRDGKGYLLLPARTVYDRGPLLLLVEGEQVPVTWSYVGSGRAGTSVTTIAAVPHTVVDVFEDHLQGDLPERAEATVLTRRQIVKKLTGLVEAGKAARWQLYVTLERDVYRAVDTAHNAVVAEINDIDNGAWGEIHVRLDAEQLTQLTTEMTYGEDGKNLHDSRVSSMIDKLITPGTLDRVDPMMYLSRNLKRDAEVLIRKRLDDTWIGPKVRRIVRSMPGASVEEILSAYNARHPADRLGLKRLADALTVPTTATVHASESHLAGRHPVLEDPADEVIARIDTVRAVARRAAVPHAGPRTVLPAPEPLLDSQLSTAGRSA